MEMQSSCNYFLDIFGVYKWLTKNRISVTVRMRTEQRVLVPDWVRVRRVVGRLRR